jgi:hypoxanthine phosphoribosyltransferase
MTPRAASPVDPLFSAGRVASRVAELGKDVEELYAGAPQPPLLVGVLKGASVFLADLVRVIAMDVGIDFISISSYGDGAGHSGVVRIVKDLEHDIGRRDVLVVEDIVDTGLTLSYLRRALSQRHPRSLATVALIDKRARRIVPVAVELTGFEIADEYVVGYGMDFQGRYRNASSILAVRDFARLANDPLVIADTAFLPG